MQQKEKLKFYEKEKDLWFT